MHSQSNSHSSWSAGTTVGTNKKRAGLLPCKPDSVGPDKPGVLSFIWPSRRRKDLTTYPPGSDEQPSSPGVFGLSTHKVYPCRLSPNDSVGSYPAFSPLPDLPKQALGGCFLWHWLFPQKRDLPVRKYGALCCPDFPPRPPVPER